jgi:predicted component of type VI protein secretion system
LRDGGSLTIGRLPDNAVHIDNLAVSGHHARIVWESDHFALEDDNSLNGTFVNNRRITRCALKDGDIILVGKHTLAYSDEERRPIGEGPAQQAQPAAIPRMDATVVLDTRQAKEMIAAGTGAAAAKERTGQLQVMDGKTDQPHYVLSGKLTVIGKSDMASIKLKGWFAPKVAAVITKRDGKYLIAASEKDIKIKVNNADIFGQKELNEGDLVEVASVKLTFTYTD